MPISISEISNMKKLSFLVFLLCVLISFKNQHAETKKGSSSSSTKWPFPSSWDSSASFFLAAPPKNSQKLKENRQLEYDFYRDSCPIAEKLIREVVRGLYRVRSDVAPALLRLAFHDCFIEGCDGSILLDVAEGMESEKDSPPNKNLKGFDIIDIIKTELEEVCPGVVSCSDIVVLAAREGVVQAGGPFYPLNTGRKDGTQSFHNMATYELPSPDGDLSDSLAAFASRGFNERETVSLLGAHSMGKIHCKFFQNRLYNFDGTDKPDPSLDPQFLNIMRSTCNNHTTATAATSPPFHDSLPPTSPAPSAPSNSSQSQLTSPSPALNKFPSSSSEQPRRKGSHSPSSAAPSPSLESSISNSASPAMAPSASFKGSLLSSPEEPALDMAHEGPGVDFGTLYYRSLLHGRGILYADQQLMAGEETGMLVRAYASDIHLFHRDFALAMMKLSDLQVLTGSMGQVRRKCSKVASEKI